MCRSFGRAICLLALSLAFPGEILAQSVRLKPDTTSASEQVVQALTDLQATLEGRYGDEGPDVSRRVDDLMRALADWDRAKPVDATAADPDSPVTAYLTLSRPAIDGAERIRARDTLRRALQDVIRGARTRPPLPFPRPEGLVDEAGAAPRFALARYADVFARATQGPINETVARMKEAVDNDPLIADSASRSDGMRKAAGALRRGNLRDAVGALEALVKGSPGSSEAHRMLATAAAIAGDVRKSVEQFEAALRIRPDDERSWIGLANMHAERGSLVDAVRTLEKAVAAIPASGGLRWRLAGLHVRLDQVGDALAQYSEAARLTPWSGLAAVYQAVATSASLQQDVARATAAAEQRTRVNPNDASAHRDLANLQMKQGRQDEAFAELAIAAWLDPDDPLIFVTLGHSLMADRRDDEAVAALERAVSLQPNLREARYALAQALTRASRRADAERHLAELERQRAEAVTREQRAIDIDALKGEAAMKSAAGQHRLAVDIWKKVIALEPDAAPNYLDLAEALVKAGSLAESLQYFVKTADMDGVAEVHLRLADVLARLGRAKESALARDTYERLRLEDFRRRSN